MATIITKTQLNFNSAAELSAAQATDGTGKIAYDKDDAKIMILFDNSSSSSSENVVIKKGHGIQGVSDLTVSVPASSSCAVMLESGKYVNTSGDDKGMAVFTASASNIKVRCIVLA